MNIYDVAKKSGVSIATVSRVINGSDKVSQKTKQKVMDVINAANYVPNAFARGFSLNTMRMVGVLCSDISVPFYARAVGNIEKALRDQGYKVVLRCTGYGVENKKRNIAEMAEQGVDAIVLIGSVFCEEDDNSHIEEAAKQVPIIMINASLDYQNVFCVYCDERNLVRDCINALFKKGYKKPLYLHTYNNYSDRYKEAGYLDGLKDNGIEPNDNLILNCDNESPETISETLMLFEEKNIEFDSVVATSDFVAIAAQRYLKARLPVIGFNNSALAVCSSPTLTSLDNMLDSMCSVSISILLKLLEGNFNVPQKTCITGKIIYRESFPEK